eukprot:CAMPEP_0183363994 /NCGR_PEP_ID=MMETSP0164_2-20130417/77790_1 /TAXON_ID=221442 /ORGANISM="Coccolithus pelagicus ssp braarudi, Strain PLY182g" /LENGTH=41 /DNA_ID= /DNA_START= /DNA_END= /DNA_ORIENTATION=
MEQPAHDQRSPDLLEGAPPPPPAPMSPATLLGRQRWRLPMG